MWMVCETCGKEVCNDLNLYRHRNDTKKIQCKKCINCDVKITSTRQIRTHMKLKHKDIPCGECKKKFYLAAARDQHKRDVHSGHNTMPKDQDQTNRDVKSEPSNVPRAPGRPNQDVKSGPSTMLKAPGQPYRDVKSGPTIVLRAPDQPNRDVYSTPTTTPTDHDQPLRDVRDVPEKPDQTSVKKLLDSNSSSRKGVFKQPKHNTRFLTSLQLCGNNLKRFHEEKVRQDPEKMRRCKEIVHNLVTFTQQNCGVSEVVKGGSLGKGTSIKEKVDIDLIMYKNSLKSVADLQKNRQEVIKELKNHILKDLTFAKRIHYSYDTKHSNRFSIGIDDEKDLIQVDLLPACNIGGGSEKVFDKMAGLSEEERSFFSVSFAKDQVRFTKETPESVKEAIRILKHWKTCEKLNISSYTSEIITINEWEEMGRPGEADVDELFKRTMTKLSDMDRINITWPNSRIEEDRSFDHPCRPVVMDPANPFNNTASLINRSDQEAIERKAKEVVDFLN